MSGDESPLANFCGLARLFPLPNVVLFPTVMQPLHIFEPRYRQMTAEALAGDRLIAMVLLRPGWENDYNGRPAIYSVACMGKIVAEQQLADGRFNILLRGLSRVLIDHEIPHDRPYRLARVDLLPDLTQPGGMLERKLRRQLLRAAPPWFQTPGIFEQFKKLLRGKLPLGSLCDLLAFALPLDSEFKQKVLEELDLVQRGRILLKHLLAGKPPAIVERKFPPEFSVN